MSSRLNPTAASLLGFLHRGEMSGWDLMRTIRGTIGRFWNVSQSQVYRELRRLAEWGYVENSPTGARDRRSYALTEAGRDAFTRWAEQEPGEDLIRSRSLLLVFFGSLVPDEHLRRVGRARRPVAEAELAAYRALEPELQRDDPHAAATLRFGIAYVEAEVALYEWLEQLAVS